MIMEIQETTSAIQASAQSCSAVCMYDDHDNLVDVDEFDDYDQHHQGGDSDGHGNPDDHDDYRVILMGV